LSDSSHTHHVVVVGAGLGGLEVAHRLARAPVRITIIDQRNHHLFQPLLYQVATASLATSEIAWPVRHLLRKRKEVTTLLAVVTGIDSGDGKILLEDGGVVAYGTLVLATGARHAYFGHDEWESHAPGLKTLEDAITIRRRILLYFERAERETDPERRAALLTFVRPPSSKAAMSPPRSRYAFAATLQRDRFATSIPAVSQPSASAPP
jgi:NADH:quinone reductase (non-electrogenic)